MDVGVRGGRQIIMMPRLSLIDYNTSAILISKLKYVILMILIFFK